MKAFQIAALLLSSRVLGAPAGPGRSNRVSAPDCVGSDAVIPTGDATSGGEADPSSAPPPGASTTNDPTDAENINLTPTAGVETDSEEESGNTSTYDDEDDDSGTVSGVDSGDSTGEDDGVSDEDSHDTSSDTCVDSSGGGRSKGFRSVLYFTNWLVSTHSIIRRGVLTE